MNSSWTACTTVSRDLDHLGTTNRLRPDQAATRSPRNGAIRPTSPNETSDDRGTAKRSSQDFISFFRGSRRERHIMLYSSLIICHSCCSSAWSHFFDMCSSFFSLCPFCLYVRGRCVPWAARVRGRGCIYGCLIFKLGRSHTTVTDRPRESMRESSRAAASCVSSGRERV